jgi:hypothetical protein
MRGRRMRGEDGVGSSSMVDGVMRIARGREDER